MTDDELKELVASIAVQNRELVASIAAQNRELTASIAARSKETDNLFTKWAEESRQRDEESRRQVEATRKKAEEWYEKMRKSHEETDRIVKETSKNLGTMGDNDGKHAEQYFQYIFDKKLEFGGIKYDKMIPNLECFNKDRILRMEFDIVLVNCQSIAIIETKNSIRSDFIWKLVKDRLPVFRLFFPEYNDRKAYLGIAGFSFSKRVVEQAEKYGVGLIRQAGDSIEMKTDKLKAY
ncbi:MAG: hypothetical protein LBB74_04935 [Chitinispirillales bacterium]|nr:hypothetical protein [Chitinispirillales bacterium]